MSGPIVASAVLFAGIGLMALALGLSARRHFRQAFAVGLFGLLTLAGTSTWMTLSASTIQTSCPMKTHPLPAQTAAACIAELARQLVDAKTARVTAEIERDAANAAADTLRKQLSKAEADRDAALAAGSDARRRLEAAQSALAQERARRQAADAQNAALMAPIGDLERENDELRNALKVDTIHRHLSSAVYSLQPLGQPDVVRGLRGRWYSVQMGPKIEFGDRQFVLADRDGRIRDAADQLKRDVLDPLARLKKDARLFVRGSADDRPMSVVTEGPGEGEYKAMLGSMERGYDPGEHPRALKRFIENPDLPDVRALSLRNVVGPALGADVVVLHNMPGTGKGRSAELILFVPQ